MNKSTLMRIDVIIIFNTITYYIYYIYGIYQGIYLQVHVVLTHTIVYVRCKTLAYDSRTPEVCFIMPTVQRCDGWPYATSDLQSSPFSRTGALFPVTQAVYHCYRTRIIPSINLLMRRSISFMTDCAQTFMMQSRLGTVWCIIVCDACCLHRPRNYTRQVLTIYFYNLGFRNSFCILCKASLWCLKMKTECCFRPRFYPCKAILC